MYRRIKYDLGLLCFFLISYYDMYDMYNMFYMKTRRKGDGPTNNHFVFPL